MSKGVRHVSDAHRSAERRCHANSQSEVAHERFAADQEHIRHHVPGPDQESAFADASPYFFLALRPHLQVVLEHDCLTVEMEERELRIGCHPIEHPVDEIDQPRAILLEGQIPLAVPVCVGDDVDLRRAHPFVAPAVRPATKNRCSSRNAAITGSRPMRLAAATSCHSVS